MRPHISTRLVATAVAAVGAAAVLTVSNVSSATVAAPEVQAAVTIASSGNIDRERAPGTKDQRAVQLATIRRAASAPAPAPRAAVPAKVAPAKAAATAKPVRRATPAARPAAPARASRSLSRTPLAPREIAKVLLARRGWGGQYSCLNSLWTKESNWRVTADNASSSAYGIPQALPGSKMSSAGADWRTNPATQITWGLGYIASRYGSPCSAWAHSRSHNWY